MIKIYPIRIEPGKGYYFINLLLNERAVIIQLSYLFYMTR